MGKVNNGLLNNFTKQPRNLTQYTAYRGVTDFTQIGQFAQFETGYSFLSVIQMPEFMVKLAEQDSKYASLVNSFKHMLEYEFRGMDGLPDITSETYTITDGINEQALISRVVFDTAITVSSNYFEKTGNPITKFCEAYLTGIKDPKTQAKTYHGLIKNNILEDGPENEVFTMLYYVTDNTMLRLERAVLLCNMQLTTSRLSEILNSTKGEISNKELTLEWNCLPIMGYEVDKAAHALLADVTGVMHNQSNNVESFTVVTEENVAVLDSAGYKYAVMDNNSPDKIQALVNAIEKA